MRRIKRRMGMLLLLGAVIWSCTRDPRGELLVINPSFLPHEGSEHKRTWLSFYGDGVGDKLKQNNILLATAIAQYEPVSIMVRNVDHKELLTLLGNLDTHHYPIEVFTSEMDTLWMRDDGPTFVSDVKGHKSGINFNFKGLEEEQGQDEEQEKQKDALGSKMADFIITKAGAKIIHPNLILDSGCLEVDGSGTAIMTESCIINDDYNPYWNKEEIEKELKLLLGLQKIIWLKGIEDEELTNSHTDLYVRFVKKGVVLVHRNNNKESDAYARTRENIKVLQTATDGKGKALEVVIIDAAHSSDHANASYLGYYLCNRALIMQTFGDEESDYRAKKNLQLAFPDRTIEEVQIDAISSAGGNVHRATQQEPIN